MEMKIADPENDLYVALRAFGQAVGPDARKYINFQALFRNERLMVRMKSLVERSISRDYLPGFEFRDLSRFIWHLRYEEPYRWYFLNEETHPGQFGTHWLRRFLMPNRFHYMAEIALNFQSRFQERLRMAKLAGQAPPETGWCGRMNDWLDIEDAMYVTDDRRRAALTWRSLYSGSRSETFVHCAERASRYRAMRRRTRPHNGWVVSSVIHLGGQLKNVDKVRDAIDVIGTNYMECWTWIPPSRGKHASPRYTDLTFVLPASPDSWHAPDRHVRIPGVASE